MQQFCQYGSVRGATGNRRPYRDRRAMKSNVLLVGLGQIGMGYDLRLDPEKYIYSHARAFSQHSAFSLVGGIDPNINRRKVFEETYGYPTFSTIEAALVTVQPDLVVIAAPTESHCKLVLELLSLAHPRVILCEKPLAYDLSEAKSMIQMCAANHVKLYVNYMRRSDIGVIEIKRRIVEGEFSTPIKGVAWYSKGFLHNGSHLFNLLEYWLGPPVSTSVLNHGRSFAQSDQEPDVLVKFKLGTVIFLAAWEEAFSHYEIELLSPAGRLRYEHGGRSLRWQGIEPDPLVTGYRTLSSKEDEIVTGMSRSQYNVAEQLALALDGRGAHLCDGLEAYRTLQEMKNAIERT